MTIAYVRACLPFFLLLPLLVSPLFRPGSSYLSPPRTHTLYLMVSVGLIVLPLIHFALCIVVVPHPNSFPFWSFIPSSDHQLSSVYFIGHSHCSPFFPSISRFMSTIHSPHLFYFTHRLLFFRAVIVLPLSGVYLCLSFFLVYGNIFSGHPPVSPCQHKNVPFPFLLQPFSCLFLIHTPSFFHCHLFRMSHRDTRNLIELFGLMCPSKSSTLI
jgi:hypothetical protein